MVSRPFATPQAITYDPRPKVVSAMSAFTLVQRPELQSSLLQVLRRPSELRANVESIRLASYNVHNLFGKKSKTPSAPAQFRALAEVILDIAPDVIGFAEVESEQVIRSLFSEYVNPELDKRDKYDGFVCLAGNDRRGINVALVTRLSVRGSMTFHDREFDSADGEKSVKFSRDLLGVEIQITPDKRHSYLHFVAHLKSKMFGAPSEIKRGLEAEEIVDILTAGTFGAPPFITQDLVLTGDMNDDPGTRVIDILGAHEQLTDVLAGVEPNYTYPTHTKYAKTRLDYVFASPSMAKRLSAPTIHRSDAADRASDHYPISAVMRVG
jgi:endonuclease/exonuclease/phosphatase family metal-dependent hydrolase